MQRLKPQSDKFRLRLLDSKFSLHLFTFQQHLHLTFSMHPPLEVKSFCFDVINFQVGIPRQSGQIELAVFEMQLMCRLLRLEIGNRELRRLRIVPVRLHGGGGVVGTGAGDHQERRARTIGPVEHGAALLGIEAIEDRSGQGHESAPIG